VLGNNFSEVKIGLVSLFSFCPVLNEAFYDSLSETIVTINFPPMQITKLSRPMRKRDPYRKWSLKMPRQTLYSRKQRKLSSTQGDAEELNSYSIEGSNEDSDEGSNDDCDVESDKESLHSCYVDMPLDSDEPIPSVDHDLLPANLLNVGAELDGNENTEELLQYLYNGCHLTTESAYLLITSFSYRHHLSGQAQKTFSNCFRCYFQNPTTYQPHCICFTRVKPYPVERLCAITTAYGASC